MTNPSSLKIVFAGTPPFAATCLQGLLQSHHQVVAVYTQPDRPKGRGQLLTASPVKELALQHHIPFYQPETLKDEAVQKTLHAHHADIMIVVAYGLMLPSIVLNTFPLGCINVHASLLPRWRGAAPIQRAIEAGDAETGVSIMRMNEGLDTGPVLYREPCVITSNDTSESLHDRLAELGSKTLLKVLSNFSDHVPEPQNENEATYARKISKAEAKLDWTQSAEQLERKIRAFNSWPVAFTELDGKVIRIWSVEKVASHLFSVTHLLAGSIPEFLKLPGTILSVTNGIEVSTGDGLLRLLEIQLPNARKLPVKDILHGYGDLFRQGQCFT